MSHPLSLDSERLLADVRKAGGVSALAHKLDLCPGTLWARVNAAGLANQVPRMRSGNKPGCKGPTGVRRNLPRCLQDGQHVEYWDYGVVDGEHTRVCKACGRIKRDGR
jgi:hypothetical protein